MYSAVSMFSANYIAQCREPFHSPTIGSSHSSRSCRSRAQNQASASSITKVTTMNTTGTENTKKSKPADANYEQKLIDSGIYPYGYGFPDGKPPLLPLNWEEINQRLERPRPSLSLSTIPPKEYQEFLRADACSRNESAVKDSILPAMLRAMKWPMHYDYCTPDLAF
jgi:hypothetical protein